MILFISVYADVNIEKEACLYGIDFSAVVVILRGESRRISCGQRFVIPVFLIDLKSVLDEE